MDLTLVPPRTCRNARILLLCHLSLQRIQGTPTARPAGPPGLSTAAGLQNEPVSAAREFPSPSFLYTGTHGTHPARGHRAALDDKVDESCHERSRRFIAGAHGFRSSFGDHHTWPPPAYLALRGLIKGVPLCTRAFTLNSALRPDPVRTLHLCLFVA